MRVLVCVCVHVCVLVCVCVLDCWPLCVSDRIQLLRREYQQARREGMTPAYEDPDPRRRGPDDDTHRVGNTHTHTMTVLLVRRGPQC